MNLDEILSVMKSDSSSLDEVDEAFKNLPDAMDAAGKDQQATIGDIRKEIPRKTEKLAKNKDNLAYKANTGTTELYGGIGKDGRDAWRSSEARGNPNRTLGKTPLGDMLNKDSTRKALDKLEARDGNQSLKEEIFGPVSKEFVRHPDTGPNVIVNSSIPREGGILTEVEIHEAIKYPNNIENIEGLPKGDAEKLHDEKDGMKTLRRIQNAAIARRSLPPAPPQSVSSPPVAMPAARVGDMHVCPMTTGPVPHVGGPVMPPGCVKVLIGKMPAARVGDMATCVGPPDVIAKGSAKVLIGGMPAARMGDTTAHGGSIVAGYPKVIIGG